MRAVLKNIANVAVLPVPETIRHPASATLPPIESYLTKLEAAGILRKSPRTLENWMRLGILTYAKIGRSVLFRRADIDAAVDRFRVKGGGR